MQGKTPYLETQGKVPFVNPFESSDRGFQKNSQYAPITSIQQHNTNPYQSNYIINKPKAVIRSPARATTSTYALAPQTSVCISPQKASGYQSTYYAAPGMKASTYHSSSVKLAPTDRGVGANEDVTKFIKDINEERMKNQRIEYEKKTAEDQLKNAQLKITQLEVQKRQLENQTSSLNDELRRVAWRLGGDLARDNRVFTGEELRMLEVRTLTGISEKQRIKQLETEVFKSHEESEKLKSINLDLKKLVKSDFRDIDNTGIDPTFERLQHKSVIESLDSRCEALKKRNDMLKNENDLLRSELQVLHAAGTPLEDKFAYGNY